MYKRNLIDYLPEFLKGVREYKAILTDAVQPEVFKLFEAIETALNDQFIQSASESAISRYEKMLKITPKASQTLDERKFTLLTMMNEQLPYTMTSLRQRLESLCGKDNYSVEVDANNYTLVVRIALTARNTFNDICDMLEKVVPANMVIDISLMYNQHGTFNSYTHEQLGAYTHDRLRNEVAING